MKEFKIEEALVGKKVVTRDGQEVKDLTWFKNATGNKVLYGIVGTKVKNWVADNGTFESSFIGKHPLDLFMADEEKEVSYHRLYADVGFLEYPSVETVPHYRTKKEAMAEPGLNPVAIQRTTYNRSTGKVKVKIVHTYKK